MKNTKRFLASLLCLMLIASLFAGVATPVHAEETRTYADIALVPGFYCLYPHLATPDPSKPITMTAVPSTEYDGYTQEILDRVAAAVILRGQYKNEKDIFIDDGALQSVIWAIVCDEKTPNSNGQKLWHLNGRADAEAYYAYVMTNFTSVQGKYVMTIWKAPEGVLVEDPKGSGVMKKYQDVLEAKLVEKHDVPTVEKKVLDWNDSTGLIPDPVGWQDSADHDIGDSIPFQITAQLRDLSKFKTYYLEFCDTMTHLTLDPDSLVITIDGVDKTSGFTTTWDAAAKSLNIKCDDVMYLGATSNSKVVVTYNATLDTNANIGSKGNPNEVYMIYSRSTGSADKGISLTDKVTVFTYETKINKVDQKGNKLPGAAFELFKQQADGSWKSLGVRGATKNEDGSYSLSTPAATDFYWKGLDDGTYRFVEVITPTGYNTIEPLEFMFTAQHDRLSEDPQLNYMESDYPFSGFVDAELLASYGYSANDKGYGYIYIEGGTLQTNIVNKTGTTLPETGGMGTAPIYMAAVVMMFSAAALLLKKRSI